MASLPVHLSAPFCLWKSWFQTCLQLLWKMQGCYPNNLAFCFLLIQETRKENKCYTNKVFFSTWWDDRDKRGHDWEQVEKKKKSNEAECVNLLIYPKAQTSFRHLCPVLVWKLYSATSMRKISSSNFLVLAGFSIMFYYEIFFSLHRLILTGFQVQEWPCKAFQSSFW